MNYEGIPQFSDEYISNRQMFFSLSQRIEIHRKIGLPGACLETGMAAFPDIIISLFSSTLWVRVYQRGVQLVIFRMASMGCCWFIPPPGAGVLPQAPWPRSPRF